MLFPLFLRRIF